VNHVIPSAKVFAELVNLGMTIMTCRNTVCRTGFLYLPVFKTSVFQPGVLISRLKESAASAAAVIVGSIRLHINEIFFPHKGFYYESKVFRYRIPIGFPNDLARVLNREFDFKVLVPIGIDLEFSLADPLSVIFIDAFNDKIVLNLKFFQSCQDREGDVPSLGVEKDLAPQSIRLVCSRPGDVFPGLIVGQEHTIVLTPPSLGTISPIRSHGMEDFP